MKDIYKILLIATLSRLALFVVSTVSHYTFAYVNPDYMDVAAIDSFPFVGQFDRWDSEIYMGIARSGYPLGYPNVSSFPQFSDTQNVPTLAYAQWAFFPLYPAVMYAGSIPFTHFISNTHALMLSGFLISNISFYVSSYFFYKLTTKLFNNPQMGAIATVFYTFCGGAIFLSSIFTEALFMVLTLGAFHYLEENKLQAAIILGLLASLTRSNGFLIAIPFFVAAILALKVNKKQSVKLTFSSAAIASGYLWFNVAGYVLAGQVFPIHVIAHNLNWMVYPPITTQLQTLGNEATPHMNQPNIFQAFYIISIVLTVIPAVYFFAKTKTVFSQEKETIKYWAFYGAMIYVIFMLSYLPSIVRYAIPLLPIYWVYAKIYIKNRFAGVWLFGLTISLSLIGAYLMAVSNPYFL